MGQEAKGVFSVKSAYHLATNVQYTLEASSLRVEAQKNRWRSIWDLNIIPRAKIGLWKIIKNLIPTKPNLQLKGMNINQVCDLCRCSIENPVHTFWRCKKVKHIWEHFFPNLMELPLLCRESADMESLWENITNHHNKEGLERIGRILWTIWTFRIQATISKAIPEEGQLVHRVQRNLEDQRKRTSLSISAIRLESLRKKEFWTPPPPTFLKLNSDASWNEATGTGGVGWVIRNSSGSLVQAGGKRLKRKRDINLLEFAAIKEELSSYLSIDRQRRSAVIVEVDALEVIRVLNRESVDNSEVKAFVLDIEDLAAKSDVLAFVKFPRAGNRVAHSRGQRRASLRCLLHRPLKLVVFFSFLSLPRWKKLFFVGMIISPYGLPL